MLFALHTGTPGCFPHWHLQPLQVGKNQRDDVPPSISLYEYVHPWLPSSKQYKPDLHMQSPSLSGPELVSAGQGGGGVGAGVGGVGAGVGEIPAMMSSIQPNSLCTRAQMPG